MEGHIPGEQAPHSSNIMTNLSAFLLYDTLAILGQPQKDIFKPVTSKTVKGTTDKPQQLSVNLQNHFSKTHIHKLSVRRTQSHNQRTNKTCSNNYINCIQQNAQIFRYKMLYLKHYASNIFRFVKDHLQGRPTSVTYTQRIKIILSKHTEVFVVCNFSMVFL